LPWSTIAHDGVEDGEELAHRGDEGGAWRGHRAIAGGRSAVRNTLYMAALSATLPAGRDRRPQRLFGLLDTVANGAHSVTGSIAPAGLGLPLAANLAPRGQVGN
jgi:hypothetical protein